MKPTRRSFMQILSLVPFFRPKTKPIEMRPSVEKVLNEEPLISTESGEMLSMGSVYTVQSFPVTGSDKHGLPEMQYLSKDDVAGWNHTGQSPIRHLLEDEE